MSVRVLLADDERLVRAGFRMILNAEPDIEIVGEAADGHEAVAAARRLRPDVVLMDIRMPGLNGIDATARLLEDQGAPRVVVVTTFDSDEYVFAALRAGASGFILKDAPEDQLIAAIHTVADGGALLAPSVTRRLLDHYARHSPTTSANDVLAQLTARETEVFRLVARGHSNAEIAHELWMSEHTVKTHVAHLLAKLALRDRVQAVVLAYESGLVATWEDRDPA
jgi:DNA-binding NarL/FixJ family response regulator